MGPGEKALPPAGLFSLLLDRLQPGLPLRRTRGVQWPPQPCTSLSKGSG